MFSTINTSFILLLIGSLMGGSAIYFYKTEEINKIKLEHSKFVLDVEQKGLIAQKIAESKIDLYKKSKERADENYKYTISDLNKHIKRLRESRSSSRFLPATTNATGNLNEACFNRENLERSLQRFDDGVTKLITEGDEAIIKLKIASDWIESINN